MKKTGIALLILLFCISFFGQLKAQNGLEDVIYLKNGTVYRGLIIEQVFNESYKIRTYDGNIVAVTAAEVRKLTKEESQAHTTAQPDGRTVEKKPRKEFTYRTKCYFFQGQALAEVIHSGFHAVNGYKFGQFGYLGFGTGIDIIYSVPVMDGIFDGTSFYDRYNGMYMPFYIYYSGDILKKKITPFYAIEAGYVFSPTDVGAYSQFNNEPIAYSMHGGFTGSAGFGAKFNTGGWFNFNILAVVDIKNMHYSIYDVAGQTFSESDYINKRPGYSTLVFPGLRFGFSF